MQSNKWRQYEVIVLSFGFFSELLVFNQLSNPKAFRLNAGICSISGQYVKLCLHCTCRVCFWGNLSHTARGFELRTRNLGKKIERGCNTAKCTRLCCWTWFKILGNAAVSKFTFCIQGLALCPVFCSVLRCVKAINAYLSLIDSSEKVNKTICRAYLLSYRFMRLHMWK